MGSRLDVLDVVGGEPTSIVAKRKHFTSICCLAGMLLSGGGVYGTQLMFNFGAIRIGVSFRTKNVLCFLPVAFRGFVEYVLFCVFTSG